MTLLTDLAHAWCGVIELCHAECHRHFVAAPKFENSYQIDVLHVFVFFAEVADLDLAADLLVVAVDVTLPL